MKRSARELERQLVAYDMVQVAPEAELGPLVMYTFFSTTEALLEALRARPLLILRLMQTNKAMYKLWDQVPRLWPVMLDAVVARVHGDALVDPYALLLIMARRGQAFARESLRLIDWDAMPDKSGRLFGSGRDAAYWKHRLTNASLAPLPRVAYDAVTHLGDEITVARYAAWDTIMPLFTACNWYVECMGQILPGDIADYIGRRLWAYQFLYVATDIIFVNEFATSAILLRVITDWTADMVDRMARISHGPLLGSAAEVTVMRLAMTLEIAEPETKELVVAHRAFYPLGVARAIDLLARKIGQLRYCLDRVHETLPERDAPGYNDAVAAALPLLPVSETRQYRELLWRDIIIEPAQQRALVVEFARAFVVGTDAETDLSAMRCVSCAQVSTRVDTQQMLAFCEDALCAQLYAQCTT